MAAEQTSFELLAHFDRPKTIDLPDFEFEWVAGSESFAEDPTGALGAHFARPQPPATRRDAFWVLQWAGALAVLGYVTCMMTEFACLAGTEHSLAIAALAGATEATLPRATHQSVIATVERRLANYPSLASRLRLSFLQNGQPVGPQFRPGDGDHLSIQLAAPSSAVVPHWLRTLMFWREPSEISAHAERQMPGRILRKPVAVASRS